MLVFKLCDTTVAVAFKCLLIADDYCAVAVAVAFNCSLIFHVSLVKILYDEKNT